MFVDLGAGKGRALLLALAFPFAQIIGVEFAAELVQVARDNVRALREEQRSRIFLVHADAVDFTFPPRPLVVFLFNPFGADILRSVVTKLTRDGRATPRPLFVIYINPVHIEIFLTQGWSLHAPGETFAILRLNPSPP